MPRKRAEAPPCPQCGSTDTAPLRNYGRTQEGRFQCHACRRWFEVTPTPVPRLPKPCPDCAGTRDGPIVHAAQPQPAAEGSLVYRPGARPVPDDAAPPCQRCGSADTRLSTWDGELVPGRYRCLTCQRWFGPNAPPNDEPAHGPVATALCLSPDDFARDAVALLAHAGPAAYLRLLRDKDPAAWRERLTAIYGACEGNAAEVARRIGMTYRGLAKLVASDPELRQAIAIRWPHTQRTKET